MIPVAEHTHAHKICLLGVDLLGRIIAAVLPKLGGGNFVAWFTYFLFDVQFNRKPMAIPAGHIRRVKSGQRFGFDNDVLEDLIDRVANVQLTVGVGRAIVKDKAWFALARLAHLGIQVHVCPGLESLGLTLRQVGLHGEVRLGQIQRGFIITHTLSVVCQPCSRIGLIRRDPRFQGIE